MPITLKVLGKIWSWLYYHYKGWREIRTEDRQLYFGLERPLAHDIGGLTAIPRFVVCSICSESVDILWDPPCCAVSHTDLLAILVPDELCRRVSTSRFACQLHCLPTANCFSLCVALNVRYTRWIWRQTQQTSFNWHWFQHKNISPICMLFHSLFKEETLL